MTLKRSLMKALGEALRDQPNNHALSRLADEARGIDERDTKKIRQLMANLEQLTHVADELEGYGAVDHAVYMAEVE